MVPETPITCLSTAGYDLELNLCASLGQRMQQMQHVVSWHPALTGVLYFGRVIGTSEHSSYPATTLTL